MHFIRPVSQAQGTLHRIHVGQREVSRNPCATMDLNGPINHPQCHVGGYDLDLSNFAFCDFIARRVHHVRGLQCQQPGHIDLHSRVGNFVDIATQPRQRFTKGRTRQ